MEDNLNFFLQMEGDLNFFQIEDNFNFFLQMEDTSIILAFNFNHNYRTCPKLTYHCQYYKQLIIPKQTPS